jgi:ATP-dependent DNA helicase RecG
VNESQTLDFKRISDKHKKIIETICAFANTEGGIIAIGVEDIKAQTAQNSGRLSKENAKSAPQVLGNPRLFGIEENPEGFDDLQRQVMQRFEPPISGLHWVRLPCTLHNGAPGHVVMLRVEQSAQVHSVVGDGTWTRMGTSNREMSASEISELAYRRGTRSATNETVPISLALLDTDVWRRFVAARGLRSGSFAEQLEKIGLAQRAGSEMLPTRAAVLLFAEEPGSLLAAHESRADVRVFVFDGKAAVPSATPNYRKPPKTVRGALIEQIDRTVRLVLDELAQGVTLSSSGFRAKHAYPERVVKEAIVNAIIHRDYRLNRDILIRIFDDRIEVESPGSFPGNITPDNIARSGSKPRNPLVTVNLREFPDPPNIDAGEGVKAMFAEMDAAKLYPPQYRQNKEAAVENVVLTLFNLARPTAWDEVSHWLDTHGTIGNSQLRRIAKVEVTEASRMLRDWVAQGLLVALAWRGRRNAAYRKPDTKPEGGLFADEVANKPVNE